MGGDKVVSHRDLLVWQKAVGLVDLIYDLSEKWPRHEFYGLTAQVRRASVSVPSNVAEGNGRDSTRDYIRFLSTSYASLMEVDTQVHIAKRRGYLTDQDEAAVIAHVAEIGRMLNGLRGSLQKRLSREGNE